MNKSTYPLFNSLLSAFNSTSSIHRILYALLFSLSCVSISDSGLTSGCHVVYGDKKISFMGDNHKAGSEEANVAQTQDLFELLKEAASSREAGMHVLVEKFASSFRSINVLASIFDKIKKSGIPGLTVEDCEIRKVAITAENIFRQPWPDNCIKPEKCLFEESLSNGEILLGDLIKEYEEGLASAVAFREAKANELNFARYDEHLETAKDGFERLKRLFERHSFNKDDKVLALAGKLWQQECDTLENTFRDNFVTVICPTFTPLLDLYLFKKVCEYPGTNITVIAGKWHTGQVRSMLEEQGAVAGVYYVPLDENIRDPEMMRLLSKSELQALLSGYSLIFVVKETLAHAYVRLLIFIFDLKPPAEPENPIN